MTKTYAKNKSKAKQRRRGKMYCKNCGKELNENAEVCLQCGTLKGNGNRFCSNCGAPVSENQAVCLKCGCQIAPCIHKTTNGEQKSKITAGLLGIFLGAFGVHNFYLGYKNKAVIQVTVSAIGLLLSCCTGVTFIATVGIGIWGLIEGILILTGQIKTDADGNLLI